MTDDTPRLVSVTERRKQDRAPPDGEGKRLCDGLAKAMASFDRRDRACDELDRLLTQMGA